MTTQTQGKTRNPMFERRRMSFRTLLASLLAVLISVSLGGGVVAASPEMCVAASESLNQAKSDYAASCDAPRVDCDKIDGIWYCSSHIIGSAAPGGLTSDNPINPPLVLPEQPPQDPVETPDPPPTDPGEPSDYAPTDPVEPPTGPDDGLACIASSASLNQAKANYATTCDAARVDCDKIDGRWYCSDQIIGNAAPGGLTTDNPSEPPAPTPEPPAPTPQPPAPTPQPPAPTPQPPTPQPPAPTPQPPTPQPPLPDGVHPDIVAVIEVEGRNPGGAGWADSYSVGDKCYCATTFDHNIGGIEVETPDGTRTVRQVCGDLGPGPGILGRPIYNDIQCGNGPANDAGDEDDCPGRVDIGRDGCGHIGPRWKF